MNLFQIRLLGDGSTWLVCHRCGVRVTQVRDGWTLADLYTQTENHTHAQ